MVKISYAEIEKVRQASKPEDLYEPLQNAIELEHSTIPPYLTAFYSIKRGFNKEVADIILSVVRQEMLHMTIAANVLNAIGGHPVVNKSGFIPEYPGKLPGNIEPDLQVGLAPLSIKLVRDIFMKIEQPEEPQDFPQEYIPPSVKVANKVPFRMQEVYQTIGEFYKAIIDKIKELDSKGKAIIIGDPNFQVDNAQWFPEKLLFKITTVDLATQGLTIIAQQGEGVGKSPVDSIEHELAHYYKFSQIDKGYHLYQKEDSSFVYNTAQPIPFDATGIYNLVENSRAAYYKPNSVAGRMVDQFNYSYTSLLNGLHRTFNGEPNYLNTVMGLMFDLKLQAQNMAERKITSDDLKKGVSQEDKVDKSLAPSFEYPPID